MRDTRLSGVNKIAEEREAFAVKASVSSLGGTSSKEASKHKLLCGLSNALNNGIPLVTFLGNLPPDQLNMLLGGITSILNGALSNLLNATLASIQQVGIHHTCAILHLALGPLDLTLLGLNVVLDNCANGAVTVDITAVTGQGNLLGNLLCELLGGNLINLGTTLQAILNQIIGLLTQ